MLFALTVTVTNAGAAPSLVTSTPIDLCEVICCGAAFNIKSVTPFILAITGSGWSNDGNLVAVKSPDIFTFEAFTPSNVVLSYLTL